MTTFKACCGHIRHSVLSDIQQQVDMVMMPSAFSSHLVCSIWSHVIKQCQFFQLLHVPTRPSYGCLSAESLSFSYFTAFTSCAHSYYYILCIFQLFIFRNCQLQHERLSLLHRAVVVSGVWHRCWCPMWKLAVQSRPSTPYVASMRCVVPKTSSSNSCLRFGFPRVHTFIHPP